MSYPARRLIEVAILRELIAVGGRANSQELYPRIAKHFTQIMDTELKQRFGIGENKWQNEVRWAALSLKQKGELSSVKRGLWEITEKGRERFNE